ncbi:hypothetical protein [Mycolicibacterium pulveris]
MAETDRMLIDSAMPRFDAIIAEHTVVRADPTTTFQAARRLDFLSVRTPLLTASMWLRGLPTRLLGRPATPPPALVFTEDSAPLPGWLLLGDKPDREIAFGAVGKFWKPAIEWRDVPRAEFRDFAAPGWGKIAANFSVRQYGERTLLSYECRTVTTDPDSRKRFLRYWWLIRPFVGHIMRATLAKIKADAEPAPVR